MNILSSFIVLLLLKSESRFCLFHSNVNATFDCNSCKFPHRESVSLTCIVTFQTLSPSVKPVSLVVGTVVYASVVLSAL